MPACVAGARHIYGVQPIDSGPKQVQYPVVVVNPDNEVECGRKVLLDRTPSAKQDSANYFTSESWCHITHQSCIACACTSQANSCTHTTLLFKVRTVAVSCGLGITRLACIRQLKAGCSIAKLSLCQCMLPKLPTLFGVLSRTDLALQVLDPDLLCLLPSSLWCNGPCQDPSAARQGHCGRLLGPCFTALSSVSGLLMRPKLPAVMT